MSGRAALLLGSLASWPGVSFLADSINKTLDDRPNIIFIFTDDQDARMQSLQYMGGVQEHLINRGAIYQHHYCTVALCCPSRVNLWTGRAAHNTNVTDIAPPYGGYEKFVSQGFNDDWLPIWMQQAGYSTYYVGKLMNSFSLQNYNNPYVKGFNGSDFLCGKGTYNYYNPVFQRNVGDDHQKPKEYKNQYTVGLTFNKSMAFLDDARQAGKPFFLTMATVAPHNGGGPRPNSDSKVGPVPEAKYTQLFPDEQVPRTNNFNPDQPSGTSWLLDIAQLDQSQIDRNDEVFRQRIRVLQSVDDMVNGTIEYLTQYNLLNNTYIIYSSDNGYHISQHRLVPGKNCPYEEDINVPLIIRGPGIEPGSVVDAATTHTDLAPTILRMAGADLPSFLDGSPVPLINDNSMDQNFEHAQVEHWGDAGADDEILYPGAPGVVNTTYKALRIMGDGYSFYYSVWCSNQHELYDMVNDPDQMNNLFTPYSYMPDESTDNPFPVNRLESRLDALLLVLKGCKGANCKEPWLAIHPDGNVKSLTDAMDPQYDEFYQQNQPRVSFTRCEPGYIVASEGPQTYLQYQSTQNRFALALD